MTGGFGVRSERSTGRFPRPRFRLVCKGQRGGRREGGREGGREQWPPTVGVRSHFECAGPSDGDVDGSRYVNPVLAVGLMEYHFEPQVVGDTDVAISHREVVRLIGGITPRGEIEKAVVSEGN